ncbi:23S rRNA (guanosine(2251)-2'-O)-methyltransferase RlmB [Aliidiomarina maris]|uniref:23S rRNA (guanosine-2'-O-)-methyltransferase RlmB n=1 Tax=Aliidiomarina maris TaxID=531312 RepID=A0A327WRP3_9GAMM|nr:23S rRNA (guanosine(2251)-2'-O)-methyltransferase RlmB [Aliidiomarina maris]MBA3988031.1 23S rRNA (guanosine(2251)-2'-O)-methyltransferase RlmB [Idiomarina sp.]MCL5049898.1 23S rRNA (guanosine(2251)-2'-O)-methyltransferase RlmB [Bacillota bacterium]RAJ95278.1 23S rRNA Gm-2251 2'-O-methyltransferase [Aliidiomarina maris]RUO21028.1 23S rRNA (guanosine(2251)-2'-O)-methyltransferase RlmB [Aliidiomarina maris]
MSKKDIVHGIHAVTSIVQHNPERLIELFVLQGRRDHALDTILQQARKAGVRAQECQRKTLDQKAQGENHQGVIAIVTPPKHYQENDLPGLYEKAGRQACFLVLDNVTDPHNLGACLRTADAAGVTAVIVPKDKSAKISSVVSKVASGAAETMPLVVVTNLARTLRELQQLGVWVIGTAGEATQTLYAVDLKGPVALVMGAEGSGMRRLTREHCDELIAIPLAGTVSSLNVSVAAGVCLFEVVRQRQGA